MLKLKTSIIRSDRLMIEKHMKTISGLLFCFFCLTSLATDSAPNIVVIFADDLGYADIGPFGAKKVKTPNLDRLAKQGRKFTNFHVAQAVCSASRAALLTGCYPNRVGISGALGPQAKVALSHSEVTIAELLKSRGYATGMAGKWHLGHRPESLPIHHGFDEYFGLPYSNDMWPHHPEARPGAYPNLPLIEGDRVIDSDVTSADQETLTTRYTERAVDFIQRNKTKPFFFYLAYAMPHVPLHVSEKFKGKSKSGLYGDVMMEIDWSVGQVMDALKAVGVDKNTLVIFTSDNGPWLSYGNHAGSSGIYREGKGTAWEGGTRVPCIMKWPSKIPGNSVSDQYLMTIDLFPTFAAMINAHLPANPIDGLNILENITSKKAVPNPHEAYANYYADNELQAVTSGDGQWKLIFPHQYRTLPNGGGTNGIPSKYSNVKIQKPELYDIKNDPSETKDVSSQHPETVAGLNAFAEKMRDDLGDNLTNRHGKGARPPERFAQTN
jgi:arylsulfatase A